jgi:hypothetical protein
MPEQIKTIIDNDICLKCQHFWGIDACDAFPDGIPDEIMHGDNMHKKPLPEQGNKIVFTPIKKGK